MCKKHNIVCHLPEQTVPSSHISPCEMSLSYVIVTDILHIQQANEQLDFTRFFWQHDHLVSTC